MLAKRIIPCLDVKDGRVVQGVRSRDDIRTLLSAGADKVSINTAAVADPEFVRRAAERFGSQCTVVAIDARAVPGRPGEWEVYTHGGRTPTGIDAVDWSARMEECGAGEILLTSMDRDGTRDGDDIRLPRAIGARVGRNPGPEGVAGEESDDGGRVRRPGEVRRKGPCARGHPGRFGQRGADGGLGQCGRRSNHTGERPVLYRSASRGGGG